jgi:hypothetical protein
MQRIDRLPSEREIVNLLFHPAQVCVALKCDDEIG